MISLIVLLAIVSNSASYNQNQKKLEESTKNNSINLLKCCEAGFSYNFKDLLCVQNHNPFRIEMINMNVNPMVYFNFLYRKPICSASQDRVVVREVFDENIALGIDSHGNLHIGPDRNHDTEIIGPESFCVDNLVLENDTATWTIFNAIICIRPTSLEYHIINSTCMIISCIFILTTVMVYMWLPELNNQHGRVLIAYLICLFNGYSLLATMKMLLYFNKSTKALCFGFTIVVYFFLLAAFFWQNVMCFDIWRTFSGRRGLMTNKLIGRDKFYTYLAYAFGIPIILTSVLIFMEYHPLISRQTTLPDRMEPCFLTGTKRLMYLYSPILILWVADSTFFILTILKIWQIQQQTSVLYIEDSATHSRHKSEKQRLFLYIKLFIVMGINWVLEVVSAHAAQDNTVWVYTDACNGLIGFFIFIIFVCKRKTFRLMKKRYAQIVGQPVVRNQSSTRTINTSVKITTHV